MGSFGGFRSNNTAKAPETQTRAEPRAEPKPAAGGSGFGGFTRSGTNRKQ